MKPLALVLLLLFAKNANAWIVDFNSDFVTETFNTTSDQKNSRQFFLLGALGDLGRYEKTRFYMGWGVISAATKDENTSASIDQKFSTMDTGPMFRINFGSRALYSTTLIYSLFTKGKLDNSGSSSDITGTSFLAKFAIEPEINENFRVGFAMNYYSAQYNKSVSNSVESDVSYKIQRMFPSISLSFGY